MKHFLFLLSFLVIQTIANAAGPLLIWDAPSITNGIIGYRVTLAVAGQPPFLTNIVSGVATLSNRFTGLLVGVTYTTEVCSMTSPTLWSDPTSTNFVCPAGVGTLRLQSSIETAPSPTGPWEDVTNITIAVLPIGSGRFYRTRNEFVNQ